MNLVPKKKRQDRLVQRLLNEKLGNIYCFPLQDEEYFTRSPSYLQNVITQLKDAQKKAIGGLIIDLINAGHA